MMSRLYKPKDGIDPMDIIVTVAFFAVVIGCLIMIGAILKDWIEGGPEKRQDFDYIGRHMCTLVDFSPRYSIGRMYHPAYMVFKCPDGSEHYAYEP
jgi:hypothetical protein